MFTLRHSLLRSLPIATTATRAIHSRVPLPYPIEQGIPHFLSPAALNTVAVDWQQGILDRLTEQVRGTSVEGRSVIQTLVGTASDPSLALAFNYASEALNNSFFLSTLTPTPAPLNPGSQLAIKLASEFSSYPAFISAFSAHVAGLHPSSGAYVWLVTDKAGGLGIVGTYAGGTVLVRERIQMGEYATSVLGEQVVEVLNTSAAVEAPAVTVGEKQVGPPVRSRQALMADPPAAPARRAFSTTAREQADVRSLGATLLAGTGSSISLLGAGDAGVALRPLVCLSVHPHCYLQDYGVWGRETYVRNWWDAINWTKVEASYASLTAQTNRRG